MHKQIVEEIKRLEKLEVLEERKELFTEMIEQGIFTLEDHRRSEKGNIRYSLQEIVLVWLCGMICGLQTYADIEWHAQSNISFFQKFFPYNYSAPSRNTIARFVGAIDPKHMNNLLMVTLSTLRKEDNEEKLETIALDGKALRGLQADETKSTVHLVSAFDSTNGIVLTQEAVPEKSNEITAFKSILSVIDLKKKVITIDALGTQKEIAQTIKTRRGDYILGVKGNQKTLHEAVKEYFAQGEFDKNTTSFYKELEKGHGRIEKRSSTVTTCPWLKGEGWAGLKSIVMVVSGKLFKERPQLLFAILSRALNLMLKLSLVLLETIGL